MPQLLELVCTWLAVLPLEVLPQEGPEVLPLLVVLPQEELLPLEQPLEQA